MCFSFSFTVSAPIPLARYGCSEKASPFITVRTGRFYKSDDLERSGNKWWKVFRFPLFTRREILIYPWCIISRVQARLYPGQLLLHSFSSFDSLHCALGSLSSSCLYNESFFIKRKMIKCHVEARAAMPHRKRTETGSPTWLTLFFFFFSFWTLTSCSFYYYYSNNKVSFWRKKKTKRDFDFV